MKFCKKIHPKRLLKRLLRLIQVASNPKLIDDNYNDQPGKLYYLKNLVDEIVKKNEKAIIWSNFTKKYRLVA